MPCRNRVSATEFWLGREKKHRSRQTVVRERKQEPGIRAAGDRKSQTWDEILDRANLQEAAGERAANGLGLRARVFE
jgi:hypothetical protein